MFTIAAVATNVCALPVGTILDRFGPRVASLIGVVLLAVGATFLAFATSAPFDAWIPGYFFLALGGPFVFIPAFQLSNTFPRYSGLILALLTGAFDTSSAVFLVYRLLYSHSDGTFKPKKFFLLYLIVPALLLVAQLLWMPSTSYQAAGDVVTTADEEEEEATSTADEASTLLNSPPAENNTTRNKSLIFGALHHLPASKQVLTPWFYLITLFTILQMLRINYFVATIRPQYTYLLRSLEAGARVNGFFDVALPLGGIASIPFIGLLLDNVSTPVVLGALVGVATAIGGLGVLRYEWAAYANIILFVLYRPLYYTAVRFVFVLLFSYLSL